MHAVHGHLAHPQGRIAPAVVFGQEGVALGVMGIVRHAAVENAGQAASPQIEAFENVGVRGNQQIHIAREGVNCHDCLQWMSRGYGVAGIVRTNGSRQV